MDEMFAAFGIFWGVLLLMLGVMALLLPLVIFLGHGELRRIRRTTNWRSLFAAG